jgi:hypothetical protein
MTARIASTVLFAGALAFGAACARAPTRGPGSVDGGPDGRSDGSCGIGVGLGCTPDDTLTCSSGAVGFVCAAGDNPGREDPTITCSIPTANCADPCNCEDLYCCFQTPSGFGSTTCVPDYALTATCPVPYSYAYQCVTGASPATLDSSLTNCSQPTLDADGVHNDYCCAYN